MDYRAFPDKLLLQHAYVWRVTKANSRPWYFSSAGTGRFDLVAPNGTCYVALKATTALLEVFRQPQIERSDLDQRRIWKLEIPKPVRLANLLSSRAFSFGLTKAISAGNNYSDSQELAAGFSASGFDGIYYTARHPPNQNHVCVSVFGSAGENTTWPISSPEPITRRFIRLLRSYGVVVLDTP